MPEFAPPNPNQPLDPAIIVPALPPQTRVEMPMSVTPFVSRGDGYTEAYTRGGRPTAYPNARSFMRDRGLVESVPSELQPKGRVSRFAGAVASKIVRFKGLGSRGSAPTETGTSHTVYEEREPLPRHMKGRTLTKEDAPGDTTLKTLIENYRQEMIFAPASHDKLANTYGVVRNIGDSLLQRYDADGRIGSLLNATRADARPRSFGMFGAEEDHSFFARHSEKHRRIELSESQLRKNAQLIGDNMRKASVEILNPSDPELFSMIQTVAHEAGHGLLAGVSRLIESVASKDEKTKITSKVDALATRLFLTANPELAFTGNMQTDIATHEERFAEGYGQMVVDAVALELGYDEKARQFLKKIFDERTAVSKAPKGTHAFDHLEKVDAVNGLTSVGKQAGIETYRGELGYSTALVPSEVASEIAQLSSLISGQKILEDVMFMPGDAWNDLVKQRQSQGTKDVIAWQLALRSSAPDRAA